MNLENVIADTIDTIDIIETIRKSHDGLFKFAYSRQKTAVGILQSDLLPEKIRDLIDFKTYRRYPTEQVDQKLKSRFCDLIYQFQFGRGDKPLDIYILFEHQSTRESNPRKMTWRLKKYQYNLWKAIARDNPELDHMPPIIPLVLYNGKQPWHFDKEFQWRISDDYPELRDYMPQKYPLVNLRELGHEAIEGDLYGKLVLHFMYAYATDTLCDTLKRCGSWFAELRREDDGDELEETLLTYIVSTHDDIDIGELRQYLNQVADKETGDRLMSIADRLEAKGREEGRIDGERSLLQSLWKSKFPDNPEVDLIAYSQDQLEVIGTRLLSCSTPEAVLDGLSK